MSKPAKSPDDLQLCPAIGFGRIVGGKYKLRILWLLNKRSHRYGELRAALVRGSMGAEPTPRILSRELKELQARGLIARHQYDVVPPKVEYSLTDRGREIIPIIVAIIDWGLTGAHEEILGIAATEIAVA
jgi:DNA-binding HxlR family transcriptional regulator